jgi:hypothetical protein
VEFTGWAPLDVAGTLIRADGTAFGEGRPAGLHLGRVIHEAKIASGESTGEVEGDQPSARVQEGFIWETVVEYVIAGLPVDEAVELAFKRHCMMLRSGVTKQLQLVRDEIHGTPDGLNPMGPAVVIPELGIAWPAEPEMESYKATRRSLRHARTQSDFESQFWTWVMQEAGYLHMAGLRRVRWCVWWLAGDYSKGKGTGPQMLEARARFEVDELAKMWHGVCMIADRIKGRAE